MKLAAATAAVALAATFIGVAPPASSAPSRPLEGVVIALDPGHQLGNSNPRFAKQMSQTRFNGSITKGCNTTGNGHQWRLCRVDLQLAGVPLSRRSA